MTTRAPSLRIVCPICPAVNGRPVTVAVSGGAETVRCPQCAGYFRVQTGTVDGRAHQQPLGGGISAYTLTVRDGRGAPSTHSFQGPLGMHLADGESVSLVWLGRDLAGLANQTAGLWYPLARDEVAPLRLNGIIAAAVALIVTVSMVATYRGQLVDALSGGGLIGVALITLALAITLAPWVSDTLARRGGE